MNHHDRAALGTLLDQLWASRMGTMTGPNTRNGWFTAHQLELLAAAMRITAGTPGPELPNPWPNTADTWANRPPRPDIIRTTLWRRRIAHWLNR